MRNGHQRHTQLPLAVIVDTYSENKLLLLRLLLVSGGHINPRPHLVLGHETGFNTFAHDGRITKVREERAEKL